jgi:hypothetical protein
MHEIAIETARSVAEDLIDVLGAYDLELEALDPDAPGVAALREAIGAVLAEACGCILDRDGPGGAPGRARH